MKKLLAFILCAVMLVSLSACGKSKSNHNENEQDTQPQTESTTTDTADTPGAHIEIGNIAELTAKDIKVGNTYMFGTYEQDNDSSNGKSRSNGVYSKNMIIKFY